jgi:hypothetical protein
MNEARSYEFRIPETTKPPRTAEKLRPISDFADYVRRYAHERPMVVGICCFGLGFVLGWKVKPG